MSNTIMHQYGIYCATEGALHPTGFINPVQSGSFAAAPTPGLANTLSTPTPIMSGAPSSETAYAFQYSSRPRSGLTAAKAMGVGLTVSIVALMLLTCVGITLVKRRGVIRHQRPRVPSGPVPPVAPVVVEARRARPGEVAQALTADEQARIRLILRGGDRLAK